MTEAIVCRGCSCRAGGVRRGRDADDAARVRHRAQRVVALEPGDVPQRAGAGVGHEHRRARRSHAVSMPVRSEACDTSIARPRSFIRCTARRPNAVRPQSAGSFRPAAEAVGVGVGDPDLPDPEAEQDVELVEVVARSGWPPRGRTRCRPGRCACANSMSSSVRTTMTRSWWAMSACRMPRSVTTSSQLPGGVPGDVGGAVHHVVEHGGQAGREPGRRTRCAGGRCGCRAGVWAMSAREPDRVIVQADHDVAGCSSGFGRARWWPGRSRRRRRRRGRTRGRAGSARTRRAGGRGSRRRRSRRSWRGLRLLGRVTG